MTVRYIAVLLILSATLLAYRSGTSEPVPLTQKLASIPAEWDGFTSSEIVTPPGELAVLRPTEFLNRIYHRGEDEVSLFVAYFDSQDVGTIAHTPRACLPFGGWTKFETSPFQLASTQGAISLNQLRLRDESRSLLAFYWYQNPQRIVANELEGKFYLALDRLVRHTSAGTFARVVVKDAPRDRALAEAFTKWVIPQVARCLQR